MVYTDGTHLVADNLGQLFDFAASIGLSRNYLEGINKGHPHFDIVNRKKLVEAVQAGAKLTNSKKVLEVSKLMAANYRAAKKLYDTKHK